MTDSDFTGTDRVRAGQELPLPRLCSWLTEHVPGYHGPLEVEQFKGGQSNPTYKLITPGHVYVLRRKPRGAILKGAHAVEREYCVTDALSRVGFPVARPLALCTDEQVIGSTFFVMEMVQGRVFWDSSLPGLARGERARYFDSLNATLARLHCFDVQSLGLGDFGKPGNYFQRQIARWSGQYQADELAGRNDHMDKLLGWLPAHIPSGEESSLIHGDFRADNVVFEAQSGTVAAVLDWELSTLGHPLADFTYHLMMYRVPPTIIGGFAGVNLQELGIPTEAQYIRTYCERTGREKLECLDFYLAFNMFRFAAILHGIKGRIARGTASSAHAETVAGNVDALARLAWSQISS